MASDESVVSTFVPQFPELWIRVNDQVLTFREWASPVRWYKRRNPSTIQLETFELTGSLLSRQVLNSIAIEINKIHLIVLNIRDGYHSGDSIRPGVVLLYRPQRDQLKSTSRFSTTWLVRSKSGLRYFFDRFRNWILSKHEWSRIQTAGRIFVPRF